MKRCFFASRFYLFVCFVSFFSLNICLPVDQSCLYWPPTAAEESFIKLELEWLPGPNQRPKINSSLLEANVKKCPLCKTLSLPLRSRTHSHFFDSHFMCQHGWQHRLGRERESHSFFFCSPPLRISRESEPLKEKTLPLIIAISGVGWMSGSWPFPNCLASVKWSVPARLLSSLAKRKKKEKVFAILPTFK